MLILNILSVIILFVHNKNIYNKSEFTMSTGAYGPYTLNKPDTYNSHAYWDDGPQAVKRTIQKPQNDPRYTLIEVPLRSDPPREAPLQAQVDLITPYNCPYYKR
jgi:hypothetical protein